MAINTLPAEYKKSQRRWQTMRAVIEGEDAVKGFTGEYPPELFIPRLCPHDQERYNALIERAFFLEITSWTHAGMAGAVFRKSIPQLEFPENIQYLLKDANGAGLGIEQVARQVVGETLAVGRVGLLVEFIDDVKQAAIKEYIAESIIEIVESADSGAVRIVEVRLCEAYEEREDYVSKEEKRYRILKLDENGYYYQELYSEKGDKLPIEKSGVKIDRIYPTRYDGSRFDYIPFVIIGAEDNRAKIDKPPLLGIAWANVAHYRNSADFEENLHIHAQGTLFISSDMSAEQYKTANPNGITVGARAGHFIGANGNATLLQIAPAGALADAMDRKILMMIGIGARYLQDGQNRQQTAEAAKIDEAQRSSGLSSLVGNCEDGLNQALDYICEFMGADSEQVEFKLNRDFYDRSLTAQEAQVMLLLKDGKAIGLTDIVNRIKLAGWIAGDRTAEQIREEVESEL